MSPTSTRARSLATGLGALATAATLSACGAGLDAQTYQQRPAGNASNGAVGVLALRNVAVEAPAEGKTHEIGDSARVTITVTNAGQDRDGLVEVSSSAAEEVVVLSEGEEQALIVPPLGSTQDTFELELRGLTRPLRSGEYVDLRLRFGTNGSTDLLVPVEGPEDSDRAVFTGEDLEGEPALQFPTGGEHGAGGSHSEGDGGSGGKGGAESEGDGDH